MSSIIKPVRLKEVLTDQNIFPILGYPLTADNTTKLDLSTSNEKMALVDLTNKDQFQEFINEIQGSYTIGIGGYAENRFMYKRSNVFDHGGKSRSLHLGVDLWGKAYTQVYAPLKGKVHSFAFNDRYGDYGATIILEHQLNNNTFYSLYGHLSLDSIKNLSEGMIFEAGDQLCSFGEPHENGHWPPHLHFQLILNMEGKKGDYPGVAPADEADYYLSNCPDPNIILQAETLY